MYRHEISPSEEIAGRRKLLKMRYLYEELGGRGTADGRAGGDKMYGGPSAVVGFHYGAL
jgi:hypothetical protein